MGSPVYGEYFKLIDNKNYDLRDLGKRLSDNNFLFNDFIVSKRALSMYIASIMKYGFSFDLYTLIENPNGKNSITEIHKLLQYLLN